MLLDARCTDLEKEKKEKFIYIYTLKKRKENVEVPTRTVRQAFNL